MADMSGRAELPEVLDFVREHLRGFAESYAERGLRVTKLEADIDNGKPFPDLVIYLEHEDVEGERVTRYSLEHNGDLQGPGDAAVSVAFGLYEATPDVIDRLPPSNRA